MKTYVSSRWPLRAALILAICIVLGAGWILGRGRESVTRLSYHVGSALTHHWPRAAAVLAHLETPLTKLGLVGAGIHEVEPGVHLYLDPGDLIGRQLLNEGTWEKEEWGWIEPYLRPGAVFVDVGAHIGVYTQKAAKAVGEQGLVVAVEPNPVTADELRRGIAASDWKNIVVVQAACGDQRTRMKLFQAAPSNTGMASLSKQNAMASGADGAHYFEVDVVPLDEIFPPTKAPRLDVLKIDTEGAETMVLRGASTLIVRYRPGIMVETNDRQLRALNSSKRELEGLLASYGYTKRQDNESNSFWMPSDSRR
jgi:FkbM family methyltransferase